MRPPLLSILGLVLGVGVVAAAPAQHAPQTNQPHTNQPQAHQTVQSGWAPVSSIVGATCRGCLEGDPCTPAQKATCKTQVEEVLQDHWNATGSTPKLPMMKLGAHEIPRDLRQGKYFKYNKAPSTFTSIAWPKGKVQAVPVDRLGKVSVNDAKKAHRQPQWDANGQKIATCDEYAYEEQYDVMRFLDAANACRGDRNCIIDVAYLSSTPGIADRTLNRKDGKPLSTFGPFPLQLKPAGGTLPKNEMFQLGSAYLYANGKGPAIPRDPELEAWLREGSTFYHLGSDGEWDWHAQMHERTKDVSDAEREEYEVRLAKFRELTAQHNAAVSSLANAIDEATGPKEHEIVLPYDMVTGDIFERYDRVRQMRERVQEVRTRVEKGMKKGTIPKNIGQPVTPQQHHQGGGIHQQHVQQHAARTSIQPVGMLGSLPPVTAGTGGNAPTGGVGKAKKPTAAALSPCLQGSDEDWGLEMMGQGRISCKIGEFLREEWARKKAGHKSCLDRNNYGCDWKPATFSARVLDKVPELDRYKWFATRCKAWTSGTFSPPAANLDAAKKIIDDAEKKIGAARQALEPYYEKNNDHGRVYRGDWGEDKTYGDKNWFGAELDFEVGWDVEAAAKTGENKNVCALAGGMKGKLEAIAHLAMFDAKLVTGDLAAEVNRSGAPNQARFQSQLTVLGSQVFKKPNGSGWVTTQIVEEDPIAFQESPKASFTVPIGGVPVTGSLWGEMGLGYAITAKGAVESGCGDIDDIRFGVSGGFGPVLSAVGRANVGVGVAGIVSAGISAALTIVRIELPMNISLSMKPADPKEPGDEPKLVFGSSLDLLLSTLSGRMSLYVEFLMFSEEWELFRWSGLGPTTVHLMPKQSVELPMAGMRPS
jgi:hypothetical protein